MGLIVFNLTWYFGCPVIVIMAMKSFHYNGIII